MDPFLNLSEIPFQTEAGPTMFLENREHNWLRPISLNRSGIGLLADQALSTGAIAVHPELDRNRNVINIV